MANLDDTDYDLKAFLAENDRIRKALPHVRYDVDSCDSLIMDDLDPQLAERLSHDISLMVSLFLHYSRKEQLIMPCLEQHINARSSANKDRGSDFDQSSARGTSNEQPASNSADILTSMWENDNRVRSIIAMAASLMPGATDRPSAGNLQSVASQLAEACDVAEMIANDEETALVSLMQKTLDAADWKLIRDSLATVRTPKVEEGSTWGPGPLDMAEARLRANTLQRGTK